MSASEVKEDLIQFVKEYVETIITKAVNQLHESERESESTAPPLPKIDSNEPCKPTADHNKLETPNSVEETTNIERNSTKLEQPEADTGTSTETAESEEVFSEKGSHARPDVTLEPVPDLPALTVAGFETDELKKTTDQSKERLENSNLNKSGQHGASNPTEEKQKEVNKTPEKTESPKQVEDFDEASEKNVNRSIDQQTESSTKLGPIKRIQSTDNSNLENQTISEPTPESKQKLSVFEKNPASQTSIRTSKAVTKEFQISIYHIVLIIMSSTIA